MLENGRARGPTARMSITIIARRRVKPGRTVATDGARAQPRIACSSAVRWRTPRVVSQPVPRRFVQRGRHMLRLRSSTEINRLIRRLPYLLRCAEDGPVSGRPVPSQSTIGSAGPPGWPSSPRRPPCLVAVRSDDARRGPAASMESSRAPGWLPASYGPAAFPVGATPRSRAALRHSDMSRRRPARPRIGTSLRSPGAYNNCNRKPGMASDRRAYPQREGSDANGWPWRPSPTTPPTKRAQHRG